VGRRHLSRVLAFAAAVVAAAAAGGVPGAGADTGVAGAAAGVAGTAAEAGVRWRELDRGPAVGPALSVPVAFVALDRASSRRFAYRLPGAGKRALARLDFGRNAAVAVFSQFGCKDGRVAVTSMVERRGTLVVSLLERPLTPGTMECQAIYPTYRLLAVPKASLPRPYPTRSEARLG
jgi:hypothetical protein